MLLPIFSTKLWSFIYHASRLTYQTYKKCELKSALVIQMCLKSFIEVLKLKNIVYINKACV